MEAAKAQDDLVAKRTGGKITEWEEYIKMGGGGVPVDNIVEGDESLRQMEGEDKEERTRDQEDQALTWCRGTEGKYR